jgi:hypothetical protein
MEITVRSLGEMGMKCRELEFAAQLLEMFRDAFLILPAFANLQPGNVLADVEDSGPSLWFETTRILSEDYRISLYPQLSAGRVTIKVEAQQMKYDSSILRRCWTIVEEGMQLEIVDEPGDTVRDVARRAVLAAIRLHARLLEPLGIAEEEAFEVCRKSWKGA